MYKVLYFSITISFLSCVSVPKESIMLSESLGTALNETERTHFSLLNLFFQEKRAQVDKFMEDTWIPEFSKDFFSNPKVSEKWNAVCATNDDSEKLKFITNVGVSLQKKINEKRQELIAPLNEMEQTLEEKLLANYNSLRVTNSVITNYLMSASKVKDTQINALKMLGIEQGQLDNTLGEVYSIMGDINDNVSNITTGKDASEAYLKQLQDLSKKLKAQ